MAKYMICPNCGALLQADHEFCGSCGQRIGKDDTAILVKAIPVIAIGAIIYSLYKAGRGDEAKKLQAAVTDAKCAEYAEKQRSTSGDEFKAAPNAKTAPRPMSTQKPTASTTRSTHRFAQECPHIAHLKCDHLKLLFGVPADLYKRDYYCPNCPPGHDRHGIQYMEISTY